MVNEELVAIIQEKYSQGERRTDIQQELLDEGYEQADIDAATSYIQQQALRQLPGFAQFYRFMDKMDSKTSHSSPKVIAAVLATCFAVLLLIFAGLYFMLDPLNIKTTERDKQRETDIVKIRTAIEAYYIAKNMYPSTLQDLLPTYLQSLPLDPKTGAQYSYKTLNNQTIYELCVSFEIQPSQCINSSPSTASEQMLVVTPTPLGQGGEEPGVEETAIPVDESLSPEVSPSTTAPSVSPTTSPAGSGAENQAL